MQKKQIPLTEEELKHITALRKRPDLLERFASIIAAIYFLLAT